VPYEKNHQPVHSVYQLHLSRENLRQNGRHENRNKSLSFLPALSNWNAPPMVRKSCAKHASLPKKPANLFRMFIVAAYPTLHRRLADGLAALQFHLCLSGVFSRWALNRMFQNETKPVLETVKVTPHVHCVVRENPGLRQTAFRWATIPKRLGRFVSERPLWQFRFGQAAANDGRNGIKDCSPYEQSRF
jgi:hypothetical protein